jgi:hypothetical protein
VISADVSAHVVVNTNTILMGAAVYYSTTFQNFRVQVTLRAFGNGYRSMKVVMFEGECVIISCKGCAVR